MTMTSGRTTLLIVAGRSARARPVSQPGTIFRSAPSSPRSIAASASSAARSRPIVAIASVLPPSRKATAASRASRLPADVDAVPALGVAHVVDGHVVVRAPEEGHEVAPHLGAEDAPGRDLAHALGDDPVLDADRLAAPRVGPARHVADRPDARRARDELLVDDDPAVGLEPGLLRERHVGTHPGADDDEVRAAAARRSRGRPRPARSPSSPVPRWNCTPCSSWSFRTKPPIASPMTRASGTASGATTCTSSPRARRLAATSRPMKPAPMTTARFALAARAMIARLSASVRSTKTCGASMPGMGGFDGRRARREHERAVRPRGRRRRAPRACARRRSPSRACPSGARPRARGRSPRRAEASTPRARCPRGSPSTGSGGRPGPVASAPMSAMGPA